MKEVSTNKVNMLLVNKADLLTREQRRSWARYFEKEGLRAVFWSALAEANRLDAEDKVSRNGRELSLPTFLLLVLQYISSLGGGALLVYNFIDVSLHRAWRRKTLR